MRVVFLEPAESEFLDAVQYYNEQKAGLGYEFALEIQKTIERILLYPEAWTKISKNARRCRCNKFPYGVIYFINDNVLLVVAIMHLNKEPDYWKDRE